MKRIVCTLTALAMVILTYSPARADYCGCFESTASYTIEGHSTYSLAVTILFESTRGKLEVDEILRLDTEFIGQERTIPRNAVRLIIKVDAMIGDTGTIRLRQGSSTFEITVASHAEAVIDLSPGPICGGN